MNTRKICATYEKHVKEEKFTYTSVIGNLLKTARKEKGLTQDAVASGIMSISFLSKIENGLEKPRDFHIELLSKRLEIDIDPRHLNENGHVILGKAFKAFFDKDLKGLYDFEKELVMLKNPFINDLINLMIETELKNHKKVAILVERLEGALSNMNNLMRQIFIVVAAVDAYNRHKYTDTINLLKACERHHKTIPYIAPIEHSYLFMAMSALRYDIEYLDHYKEAIDYFKKYPQKYRHNDLYLNYLMALAKSATYKAKEEFDHVDTSNLTDCQQAIYYDIYLRTHKENATDESDRDILNKIKTVKPSREKYKALKTLYFTTRSKQIKTDITKQFDEDDYDARVEYIPIRADLISKDEAKRDYIKDIALPSAYEAQDIDLILSYKDTLIAQAIKNSRYKEAVSYVQKTDKYLRALNCRV